MPPGFNYPKRGEKNVALNSKSKGARETEIGEGDLETNFLPNSVFFGIKIRQNFYKILLFWNFIF